MFKEALEHGTTDVACDEESGVLCEKEIAIAGGGRVTCGSSDEYLSFGGHDVEDR